MNSFLKGAGRLLEQTKADYMINLKFEQIEVKPDDALPDCVLVVEWKRGPES
jgi:hypothetical protein